MTGSTSEWNTPEVQPLRYSTATPSDVNLFRITAPVSTFNENPGDSLIALTNAPRIHIYKASNRVPDDFKDLFGPHLQGEIWKLYLDEVMRGSVFEGIITNEPAMKSKETSFMHPWGAENGIYVSSINEMEAEPVFHKVRNNGGITNNRLPTLCDPFSHDEFLHTWKVPASNERKFLEVLNSLSEVGGVDINGRRRGCRFCRGARFIICFGPSRRRVWRIGGRCRRQSRLIKRRMNGYTVHG